MKNKTIEFYYYFQNKLVLLIRVEKKVEEKKPNEH